jgi:O-antigen ligase
MLNKIIKKTKFNFEYIDLGGGMGISYNDDKKTLNLNKYSNSIKMFKNSPIIGYGPKSYRSICLEDGYDKIHCSTHSHNTYLQLLVETGVFGFVIILGIFTYLTYKLFEKFLTLIKRPSHKLITDYQVCLIIAIYISLWPFAPSMNFFGSWISIIYFLPVGFYLASNVNTNIN